MAGDRPRHDRIVLENALGLAPQVDVLLLAQASMARLAEALSAEIGRPGLSSLRTAEEL